MKINRFISIIMLAGLLLSATLGGITHAENEQDWIPDPNLRQIVRNALALPDNVLLTKADMKGLTELNAENRQITNLTGLEHAINLTSLSLTDNPISDISPLSNLVGLRMLNIGVCKISNIHPLANLTRLERLGLRLNRIEDISPLSNLMNLTHLGLNRNQIVDVSPLRDLKKLTHLWIAGNPIRDFTPLFELDLTHINVDIHKSDEPLLVDVDIPKLPVQERINNRSFPSICSMVEINYNLPPHVSANENTAYHDIMWAYPYSLKFSRVDGRIQLVGSPENVAIHDPGGDPIKNSIRSHEEISSYNPNLVFMFPLPTTAVRPTSLVYGDLSDEIPWLRDPQGMLISGKFLDRGQLIDFSHPHYIDMLVEMAVAVDNHAFYDGIIFDNFCNVFNANQLSRLGIFRNIPPHLTAIEKEEVRVRILQRIREAVSDDFLILVSGGERNTRPLAPYVNGMYTESYRAIHDNYSYKGLRSIEKMVLWAEANLQSPNFTCFEAEGLASESPNSPANRQWMRLFTTLSLTHTDGYVAYTMGIQSGETHQHDAEFRMPHPWTPNHLTNDINGHGQDPLGVNHGHSHHHYWYDFYDAELGRPIGKKAQLYEDQEGLFIREFTNGWAVYNRSGKEQQVEFSEAVSGVASGIKDKHSHALPDLDGEIYLKTIPKVEPGEYPPLYWIDTKIGNIQQLVDAEVKNLVSEAQNATSLTIDITNEKLYWTEKTSNRTGKIQRANLDGTNVQLVKDLTSAPLDISLDTVDGKLYLSNAWGKIQRMNSDGSNFQPNLITDLTAPQNLVLDRVDGKLYWTEQLSKTTGKVQRANLDGSNVQLVKELTSAPRGMTLDAVNRKLYLTNGWGKLQRMNLDGSNFQPNFITGLEDPGQVVVDRVGGKLYWTEKRKLRRADLNGENIQEVITGLGELADLDLGIDSMGEMGVAAAPAITTVVEQTQLLANYPNPFNPETWIPYHLANPSDVRITIYDARGTAIRHLDLGHQREGSYTRQSRAAYWDGRNTVGERVASGVYFYTLIAGDFTVTRKLLIRK